MVPCVIPILANACFHLWQEEDPVIEADALEPVESLIHYTKMVILRN